METKKQIRIEFFRHDRNPETGVEDATRIAVMPWPIRHGCPAQVVTVDGQVVVAHDLPELADKLTARYGVKAED